MPFNEYDILSNIDEAERKRKEKQELQKELDGQYKQDMKDASVSTDMPKPAESEPPAPSTAENDKSEDGMFPDKSDKDLEQLLAKAAVAPKINKWDYLNTIYEGDNYQREMTQLNSELVKEESRLNKNLKDERAKSRMIELIGKSIDAAATMYAASQGIKTALSKPIDINERERLMDIKDDIDNERSLLRTRIGNNKQLVKESYQQQEAEAIRDERRTDKETDLKERRDWQEEQRKNQRQDRDDRERARKEDKRAKEIAAQEQKQYEYDTGVRNREASIRGSLKNSESASQVERLLKKYNVDQEVIDEVIDGTWNPMKADVNQDKLDKVIEDIAKNSVVNKARKSEELPASPPPPPVEDPNDEYKPLTLDEAKAAPEGAKLKRGGIRYIKTNGLWKQV